MVVKDIQEKTDTRSEDEERKQWILDRKYIYNIKSSQRSKPYDWYLKNKYGRVGTIFGAVWISELEFYNPRTKNRVAEINHRWPRHWQKKKQNA